MARKYLDEIGYDYSFKILPLNRVKKYKKYEEKIGVYPPDCWNLDYHMMAYLYERLIQYKKDASGIVDLTYHRYTRDEQECSQLEMIDKMIEIAEFILMDLDNISKRTKTYKRLINNKYYVKFGKFNDFNEEQCKVRDEFWKIWAEIYPTMWW